MDWSIATPTGALTPAMTLCTLDRNLVSFGPVIPEITTLDCVNLGANRQIVYRKAVNLKKIARGQKSYR